MTGPGWRRGLREPGVSWGAEARGDAGGLREELRRGAAERGSGRGGPGPRCEASAGRAGAGLALIPRAAQPGAMGLWNAEEPRRAFGFWSCGPECGPGGASVCWGWGR